MIKSFHSYGFVNTNLALWDLGSQGSHLGLGQLLLRMVQSLWTVPSVTARHSCNAGRDLRLAASSA